MSKEIVRYNLDSIVSHDARINIIYGERSNGKSYQVKHKRAIEKYLKTGSRFILMRRWREEITSEKILQYFADVNIEKLTDGKYNTIAYYRKTLFLANLDYDTQKVTRGDKIGYVVALSTEQNYAGGSYLDVEDIIFEEFMSRSVYLAYESDKLMNFISTVDRNRNIVKCWLVGNSISQVCPYLQDWGLDSIIFNMKQGDIRDVYIGTGVYNEYNEEIKLKIAIEYCRSTGNKSYAIGRHKDMLNKGAWQTDPQPHLPDSYRNYTMLFRMMFQYQNFKFVGEYIKHNTSNDYCWYIYPYPMNKEIKDNIIVFSDVIKTSRYWQKDIYNPLIPNKRIVDLLKTFRVCNIFYSDDLCGTNFKKAIDFEIRK